MLFASALFGVVFESPLAAAAVAGGAVSIPIIIHLLNRRRFRVVEWAAMRFLLAAQKKNARRMRIEQLLLLAVRCLIVLVLILAMTSVTEWAERAWRWLNPTGGKGLLATGLRTHRIIVVDGSFSMGAKLGNTTAFQKARALAEQVVTESTGGDGFSVVLMAAPPRRIVPEPSEDARKVAAEVRGLRLTHGNADLAGTLTTVASLLRDSPDKFPAKEVYFITDLQRSGWLGPRPGDLSAALHTFAELKAKAIFLDVGQDNVNNLAVTGLELLEPVATTAGEMRFVATLFNHGDTRDDVAIRFFVGRARGANADKPCALREVASKTERVRRGQQTSVAFSYKFPSPGDYVVQVQAANDALTLDDSRSVVVRVKDTVPVLLVNGKPTAREAFDRATEWLKVALYPFDEGERAPATLVVRPRVVTAAQFADAATGSLDNVDAVYLCDVPSFSRAEVTRLESFIRRGGAVVVSLGSQVKDFAHYNEVLYKGGQGLLPAELVSVRPATPGYTYQLTMDPEAHRHDPLRPFQDDTVRELLLRPHFSAFVQTGRLRAVRGVLPRRVLGLAAVPLPGKAGKADRSAAPPGGPAVLEWQPPLPSPKDRDADARQPQRLPGRGRVVLITTTLNSDWNNWPVSPAFPPFMQELLFFAAGARLRERALSSGEPIEMYLGLQSSVEASVEVPRDPTEPAREGDDAQRRVSTQVLADGSVLRFGETDTAGVYKVLLGQHPREHLFAVNVPASTTDHEHSESNLARTNKEELKKAFSEWDVQVTTDLAQVEHARPAAGSTTEAIYRPQGPPIARVLLLLLLLLVLAEVVLAWQFGHYSATANQPGEEVVRRSAALVWVLRIVPWVLFAGLLGVVLILVHDARTGDFLGFLPDRFRAVLERGLDVPPAPPDERPFWRLEYRPYLVSGRADPWLVVLLGVAATVAVGLIYWQEGNAISAAFRSLLLALRVGILLLLLVVFLPQLQMHFERKGWPDLVLLIDDSASMGSYDVFRDEQVRGAAEKLVQKANLTAEEEAALLGALGSRPDVTKASRLRLAQTWLTGDGEARLRQLIESRQFRLHVYRCSSRAQRQASVTRAEDVKKAVDAVNGLRADPAHDSSQLGTAVMQVLNDFRGSSLAAIVLFSDGVTTEGEKLFVEPVEGNRQPRGAAAHAARMGVPLFFVGIGDAHEARDVYLHDLQVEDSVFVNDRLIFEVKLTGKGYKSLSVPVTLYEKGKQQPLFSRNVSIDEETKTAKVRLEHKPTEPGEKVYVIRTPVQQGEVDRDNNQLERTVYVREAKQIKVLYVEGYRRYEYHYLKTLLERESNRVKGNKSVDLRVVLLDADAEFHKQDRTALESFPTPFKNVDVHTDKLDLWSYDVVILGDIDPDPPGGNGKMAEHLKDLAAFVRERGGGLLVLAGERFSPRAYRNTALKDVLPIDLTADRPGDGDDDLTETYRTELTPIGRMHPIFRFAPDEKESDEVWGRLKEFYWHADGYVPKRAAEVLAVHPSAKAAEGRGGKHALVLQQFSGAGRCMFFGFNETWRWNWREDQYHYNQFWIQTVRYLARSKVGRIELRLDRQTPYRRGEPIQVSVRFPDDEKPPPDKTEVRVVVERRATRGGEKETRTMQLRKLDGSRGTFQANLEQTPEGEYRFWLATPQVKPLPQAECKVLAPPGELELLRMNQAEMQRAAEVTGGKFYSLADADELPARLPAGDGAKVKATGRPFIVWNFPALFLLVLGLFATEWLLRKQKNLL